MKKLRVIYDIDGIIINTIGLQGPGEYPKTKVQELAAYPQGTKLIEMNILSEINAFLSSDENRVENDVIIIGPPRQMPPPPPPPRDLAAEIDLLETRIIALENK